MCAIGGFNWQDINSLKRMMSVMSHRGPDGEGYFTDERISLGHKRLSIIDLSLSGKQPMQNEDANLQIVYNGEIYNYIELRQELRSLGHRFSSKSDTEVILHAYEQWGPDCLRRLNGMFAFCIYDIKKRTLFLARDRFGVKPLYYFAKGNKFAFSSEIKALLNFDFVRKIPNENIVFDYLLFNCYDHLPQTFFKDIDRVMPGHYLLHDLDNNFTRVHKWYEIPLSIRNDPDFGKAKEEFSSLFLDSIKLRLRSDVEVGSCLSGGLDSSSIVCTLNKFLLDGSSSRKFKTFSVLFPGSDIDETPFVKNVRSVLGGFEFYSITPTLEDLMSDMNRLVYHQEEPFAGTSIFAQWEVMKLASNYKIKVLLDGQGGDELLAGYVFLYGYYFTELISKFNLVTLCRELFYYKRFQLVDDGLLFPVFLLFPFRLKPIIWDRYFHHCLNKEFINKYMKDSSIPSLMYRPMGLNKGLYYRMKYGLPLLLREEDKNSMAFSIETRLPFLDYRMVEFLFSLPPSFKINKGVTKHILREGMKNIIPESVRMRRSKLGFTTPVDDWFRQQKMFDLVEKMMASETTRKYFDYHKARKLLAKHINKEANIGQTLWKLVNLNLWFDTFIAQ